MLWDVTISKSLDRYSQRRRVTGARETQITISVTLAVTLAIEQVPNGQEVVAPAQQETSFGTRGENLGEAGEEGRNYLLQLRLLHLLQARMRISVGKAGK